MRLLLTNDDGINAQGIKVLAEVLSENHEVWIVAPKTNKSGASNSIRIMQKLDLVQETSHCFGLDGTPTDCVISAVLGTYIKNSSDSSLKFDAVISGINQGPNLGTDVIYSGTCGAAKQAVIYGIPGIALSVNGTLDEIIANRFDYKSLAVFVSKNLEFLLSLREKNQFININAPSGTLNNGKYSGVRFATLSFRDYGDNVEILNENQNIYSYCRGGVLTASGDELNDTLLSDKGYVTVSLVEVYPSVKIPDNSLLEKFNL